MTPDGMSVDTALQTGISQVSTDDTNLAQAQASAKSGSSADMLKLEQSEQRWSIDVQLTSNMVKSVSDAIKAVVRNIQ